MIRKVCGIETEYGILTTGAEQNPILASSLLINAYLGHLDSGVSWDYAAERPEADARGERGGFVFAPDVEPQMLNAVLRNGARYYVDHAHPEISTPECSNPLDAVLYDCAAEEIIRRSANALEQKMESQVSTYLYKNNCDGKGNSYGCHENYLVQRSTQFDAIVAGVLPHFVTRQIYCGSGKVGVENLGSRRGSTPGNPFQFQISQRADYFETEVGLETTIRRPLVNTRDEPHCDAKKYRRLHVICGDANMSQVATFLKLATTSVILAMIEDGVLESRMSLADPVRAVQDISSDPTLSVTVELRSGDRVTALDIQEWLCMEGLAYLQRSPDCIGEESAALLGRYWPEILSGLRLRSPLVLGTVDWIAKERILLAFASRHGIKSADPRLQMIDLQYHDMRREKGLALRAGLQELVRREDIDMAIDTPPADTRAFFRGTCVARWPDSIFAANWDSVVLKADAGHLRRIPLLEPLRGTAALTNDLFNRSLTPDDLIAEIAK